MSRDCWPAPALPNLCAMCRCAIPATLASLAHSLCIISSISLPCHLNSSPTTEGWTTLGQQGVRSKDGGPRETVEIVHRYAFSSTLKRMSTLVAVEPEGATATKR